MNQQMVKWVNIVIMTTIKKQHLKQLDKETLIGAGMLGYSQALSRFDPDRGIKFETFAEHRIRGAVLDEARKMIGDIRYEVGGPIISNILDVDMSLMGDGGMNQRIIESSIDLKHFMKNVRLDTRELEILQCRVIGMNLKEIGQKFGFSESYASQLLDKIKKEVYLYYRKDPHLSNIIPVGF